MNWLTKQSLIQTRFHSFTSWKQKSSTRCITTLRLLRQSIRQERRIWQTGIWTIFAWSIYLSAGSRKQLRMWWDFLWEIRPIRMNCKTIGTSLRLPSLSWREENWMRDSATLRLFTNSSVTCSQISLISITTVSESGPWESTLNWSPSTTISLQIRNL